MTIEQKAVLTYMDDHNIGAICFEGGWKFPVHFREDADLAKRYACRSVTCAIIPRPADRVTNCL